MNCMGSERMKYYEIGQRIRRYRKACGLSQEALSVQTDALLYDTPRFSKTVASEHIQNLLDSCTTEQLYVIIDTLEALKVSLDKHVGD